jgi:hypothetical protein
MPKLLGFAGEYASSKVGPNLAEARSSSDIFASEVLICLVWGWDLTRLRERTDPLGTTGWLMFP